MARNDGMKPTAPYYSIPCEQARYHTSDEMHMCMYAPDVHRSKGA